MPEEPKAPPTSRLARTGRVGGLVAGQGLRWAGTRAANLVRTPERADAATGERAAGLARELVAQLGQMRGAAMKIGQVLSTVDFTASPESEREELRNLQVLLPLVKRLAPGPDVKALAGELRERIAEELDRVLVTELLEAAASRP